MDNLEKQGDFPPIPLGTFSKPISGTETENWKLCPSPLQASFPGHTFVDEESRMGSSCVMRLGCWPTL